MFFDNYRISATIADGGSAGPVYDSLYACLNGPAFLEFIRGLTGDERGTWVDAQATSYGPGAYLTLHDDRDGPRNRLYTFVLNLTPKWRQDWGGCCCSSMRTGMSPRATRPPTTP